MVLGDISATVIHHLSHYGLKGPGKGPEVIGTQVDVICQVLLALDSARWAGRHHTLSVHVSLCGFMPEGGAGVTSQVRRNVSQIQLGKIPQKNACKVTVLKQKNPQKQPKNQMIYCQ